MFPLMFKFLYLVVLINSLIIGVEIGTNNTYTRDYFNVDENNSTKSNTSVENWPPSQLKLGMINYACARIPSSNIDVSERDLVAFWDLPPKTRLSPIMSEIGRCEWAKKKMSNKSEIDSIDCYCVEWWPLIYLGIAVVGVLFNFFRIIGWFSIDNPERRSYGEKSFERFNVAAIAALVWGLGGLLIFTKEMAFVDHVDNGLSFTMYGDYYSKNYYKGSIDWLGVYGLMVVNAYVMLVDVWINSYQLRQLRLEITAAYYRDVVEWIKEMRLSTRKVQYDTTQVYIEDATKGNRNMKV